MEPVKYVKFRCASCRFEPECQAIGSWGLIADMGGGAILFGR